MILDAIDVFSGTGGISKALHDIVTTIQYCEIHPYCQQVLFERMQEGKLHPAPIHSDIKTLRMSSRVQPTMIMGGFPCQDISTLGLKQGIANGTRSGLFHEIMRLVDECPSIQIVFLENVGNILKCGIKDVIESLIQRRFNLQWTIRSASSFGAPHVRNRWFCLAVRGNPDLSHIDCIQNTENIWLNTPTHVYTFKPTYKEDATFDPNWTMRCQCLGNAVVPHVVRYAFLELVECYKRWSAISDCLSHCGNSRIEEPFPSSALIHNEKLYAIPQANHDAVSNNFHVSIKFNDKTITFQHLPTPRRGMTHASSLTERSLRDLPTVLLYSDVCKAQLEEANENISDGNLHSKMITNVNFIEWMMGYEKDWTKIQILATSKNDLSNNLDESTEDIRTDADSTARPKIKALNGMHMLMKEHKGKSIKQICDIWKGMSEEDKEKYKKMAKLQRDASN